MSPEDICMHKISLGKRHDQDPLDTSDLPFKSLVFGLCVHMHSFN